MSMRKVILAIVLLLVGCCGTCFGRKLVEPDTLTFKKTYSMDGRDKKDLYGFLSGWPSTDMGLEYSRFCHDRNRKEFRGRFWNVAFGNRVGDIFGDIYIVYRDGGFDLVFTNINAHWKYNFVHRLSTHDDRFNRTWYWRATHNAKLIDEIRKRSKEIFEMITTSMDHYLEVGPPVELNKL